MHRTPAMVLCIENHTGLALPMSDPVKSALARTDESEDEDAVDVPSRLALRVRKLREAALDAIRERERLPQPLFWSLFHSEITTIRDLKDRKRRERKLFLGIEDS